MKPWEKRNRQRQDEREFCPGPCPRPLICTCGHDADEHSDEPFLGPCQHPGCTCKAWSDVLVLTEAK